MKIILASTSRYRSAQLQKAGVPFTTVKPTMDEDSVKAEILKSGASARTLALKLSVKKGESIWKSSEDKNVLIISGSLRCIRQLDRRR